MNDIPKMNKAIIGFSLLATNIIYIIVSIILVLFASEYTMAYYYNGFAGLLTGIIITILPSIIFLRHALINNLVVNKIIIRLAIYHMPSLIGLVYFMLVYTEII